PTGYKRQELTILKKHQTHVKVNTGVGFVILACFQFPFDSFICFTDCFTVLAINLWQTLCGHTSIDANPNI
ncbi:MAG: hypothetical protein ABJC98_07765, partial [Bacteroidota bacterium]